METFRIVLHNETQARGKRQPITLKHLNFDPRTMEVRGRELIEAIGKNLKPVVIISKRPLERLSRSLELRKRLDRMVFLSDVEDERVTLTLDEQLGLRFIGTMLHRASPGFLVTHHTPYGFQIQVEVRHHVHDPLHELKVTLGRPKPPVVKKLVSEPKPISAFQSMVAGQMQTSTA